MVCSGSLVVCVFSNCLFICGGGYVVFSVSSLVFIYSCDVVVVFVCSVVVVGVCLLKCLLIFGWCWLVGCSWCLWWWLL